MRNEYFFRVADLLFSVNLPDGWDMETLLPSFLPFQCGTSPEGKRIFRLLVVTQPFVADGKHMRLLDESSNDMGHVRLLRGVDGYRMEIDCGSMDGCTYVMTTDCIFDCAMAFLQPEDPNIGLALSSMLRILYAQAILGYDGVSIHASCVNLGGKSYLFLGKSGTGKSTHARQWMEAFSGCSLLNDDNPVLRLAGDGVAAYGSPWSGKTPCYKNECYPVAGIARLQQAVTNRFTPLADTESFAALLPSCSAIRQDACLQDPLYRTLICLSERVPVGLLECRPDAEAAQLCFEGLHIKKIKDEGPSYRRKLPDSSRSEWNKN